MKYIIMSDSHGHEESMINIIMDNYDADGFVFLGDGERDFEMALAYGNIYPYGDRVKDVFQVRGNCDRSSNEAVTLLEVPGGIRTLITHGFDQNVKLGYNRLAAQARGLECKIALFGHTHNRCLEVKDGVTLFNPGSVRGGSYGILTINSASEFSFQFVDV